MSRSRRRRKTERRFCNCWLCSPSERADKHRALKDAIALAEIRRAILGEDE